VAFGSLGSRHSWPASGSWFKLVGLDGRRLARLTYDSGDDGFPDWSPDGAKLTFSSDRAGDYDAYVMNTDGSDQVRLTTNPDFDGFSTWSPDGSQISFTSKRTGSLNLGIFVMQSDGTAQLRLTGSVGHDFTPSWGR